ncbi:MULTISPECIES: transposase, partial [unclassified Halomonas]
MVNDALHDRFETYLDELAPRLGHADRVKGFQNYCRGLMLPLERKSVEPIAASVDPGNVQ